MWVPGQPDPPYREMRMIRIGLADSATGLYGDLPPGAGPLLQMAAALTARAFTAYAEGDWETCDALVTEGRHACGEIFTALTERIVSPAYPYRVDSPFWEDFLARLAVAVLRPVPAPRRTETEAEFRERLSRVRAEAEARMAARRGGPAAAPEPSAPRDREPDLSRPGGLADELRAMGLM